MSFSMGGADGVVAAGWACAVARMAQKRKGTARIERVRKILRRVCILVFPLGEERVLERFHNERALSSVVQGARKTTFEGGAFEVGNCGTVVGSSVGITFQGGIG